MKRFLVLFFLSFSFSGIAQHQDKVDFVRGEVNIVPLPFENKIEGTVNYELYVLKEVDSVFVDARNMEFESIFLDFDEANYEYDQEKIILRKKFEKGKKYLLSIAYTCIPKQTVYFSGWKDAINGNEQIWTQGQGKYTSHWLPSFDDMEEKIEFDLKFSLKTSDHIVIANGLEFNKGATELHTGRKVVSFDMQKPMSSYLLAFAIGNYETQELTSASGITIENYYYPQDSLKVEPTYRYTKEIFDFLEEEIGFPYPWQNYKQIPVRDFLYAGMENTTATIFSDGYMIDSTAFVDKNYVNVNAHELAHQWFGNLVTEKDGNHHWLHEGFATYYAQLAERKIFGDDHYYWKLHHSLTQLQDGVARGEGQALTDPKASSLIFYEKGAWALFMLRNQIGDKAFQKGIRRYLKKYQFKNVTIANFLKEMETASGQDLSAFRKDWLANTELPFQEAKNLLSKKSESIKLYFELEKDLITFQEKAVNYKRYWTTTNSLHLKKQMLERCHQSLPQEILDAALQSDTLLIRQQLVSVIGDIKRLPYPKVVALLQDESYVTVENTLFRLWEAYPDKRIVFLDVTRDVMGLPNKNVRLLWLTLAIVTNGYDTRNTRNYFNELNGYTAPVYGWEIRMGAFQYLNQALGLDEGSLRNLVDATNHHSWQFKKFARNLVVELLKDKDYKARLELLANELNESETRYLKSKLSSK